MGGWNYNCFPYMYARYSVGGYGMDTPNYYKIQQFGGGDINKCVESNQFCYVCEPPSEGTSLNDFQIFPEPEHSDTWQQATQMVTAHANSSFPPKWNYDMVCDHSAHLLHCFALGFDEIVPSISLYFKLTCYPFSILV